MHWLNKSAIPLCSNLKCSLILCCPHKHSAVNLIEPEQTRFHLPYITHTTIHSIHKNIKYNLLTCQGEKISTSMANQQLKPVAGGLLFLNFLMYLIVAAIGGWAINKAIDQGFIIGAGLVLPAHFSPVFFHMGNAATGFFVIFALIAGVVGAASAIAGVHHIQAWNNESLPASLSAALIAWALTLLAMGLACKEINLEGRNACLRTMEAFLIILSATQLGYILAIHGAASAPGPLRV